ncbi:MAG TPA: nuclear transport factor 2 family protein [Actinomycetota bacterium]|nr:nuclear transport factor 2 family protein [Actinomycetota bacterium]
MAHPNVETLRRIDEAQTKGDMDAFFADFTDDVVVHIPGTSKLAGTYKGKDQLGELFGKFMEAVGDYTFEGHSYLADDEHGVSLQNSKATRGGKTLETRDAFISHFRDGKISEFWIYTDDQAGMDDWIGR